MFLIYASVGNFQFEHGNDAIFRIDLTVEPISKSVRIQNKSGFEFKFNSVSCPPRRMTTESPVVKSPLLLKHSPHCRR
jgi:hypothetical protein